jgi:dTDP-glucose 4,6-dehydratase
MRILVTGGAGFIGSHFVKRVLKHGEEVVVLDKLTYSGNRANLPDDVEFHEGDIADPEAVARATKGCAAIVNFAAETHVDRSILSAEDFGRTEFRGTQVLLEHLRESDVRMVQVSTDEVYGDLEAGGSSKETDALHPSSPYSAAKSSGDLLVIAYARTFGVNASITRGSNTYGPNQYPEKFIPLFVTNALDREPLPLYGDGRQVRDWLFVEDHCAGIELVLHEGGAGEIYNVGGGDEHENIDVAGRILELTGADRSLLRSVPDRPGHDRRYSLDTTKLSGLGWTARMGFDDGLRETVEWYSESRAWWEPIKSGDYREYYERQYAERLANATSV